MQLELVERIQVRVDVVWVEVKVDFLGSLRIVVVRPLLPFLLLRAKGGGGNGEGIGASEGLGLILWVVYLVVLLEGVEGKLVTPLPK